MALTLVLQILKRYWPYIAIGILILSMLTYMQILKGQIVNRESEIEELKVDIVSYKSEAKICNGKIQAQNDSVKDFKKKSDEQQRNMDRLYGFIDKIRLKNTTIIKEVLMEKTPENCKESIQYLIDSVRDLRWEN